MLKISTWKERSLKFSKIKIKPITFIRKGKRNNSKNNKNDNVINNNNDNKKLKMLIIKII